MRKLCSVQTIKSLDKIEGKDRIFLASFVNTGWHVIVGTDLKVGDMVVYCEVDTVLPVKPEFEFLRPRCWNNAYQGFRIKAMKMGNVFSEGIVFPLYILPEGTYNDGQDITELIGAVKYDPEAQEEKRYAPTKKYNRFMRFLFRIPWLKKILLPGKKGKNWPPFISHTDETRCISKGTWIFTDKGQILIEDIVRSGKDSCKVLTMNMMTMKQEFKKIMETHLQDNVEEWVEITLTSGRKVCVTPEHLVAVYRGESLAFIKAEDVYLHDHLMGIS